MTNKIRENRLARLNKKFKTVKHNGVLAYKSIRGSFNETVSIMSILADESISASKRLALMRKERKKLKLELIAEKKAIKDHQHQIKAFYKELELV